MADLPPWGMNEDDYLRIVAASTIFLVTKEHNLTAIMNLIGMGHVEISDGCVMDDEFTVRITDAGRITVQCSSHIPFDLTFHLQRQRRWALHALGPGDRRRGVIKHIRKELEEIEAQLDGGGSDECEWIDILMLGADGAFMDGHSPHEIARLWDAKLIKNTNRKWPDWRSADPNEPIEHDRSGE